MNEREALFAVASWFSRRACDSTSNVLTVLILPRHSWLAQTVRKYISNAQHHSVCRLQLNYSIYEIYGLAVRSLRENSTHNVSTFQPLSGVYY